MIKFLKYFILITTLFNLFISVIDDKNKLLEKEIINLQDDDENNGFQQNKENISCEDNSQNNSDEGTTNSNEIVNNTQKEVDAKTTDNPVEVAQAQTAVLPSGEDGNMIQSINETRTSNGLNRLTYDPTLYSVADIRLNEISTYFSHTRPDGTEFYTVSIAVDGENLSKFGSGDAASSFLGFMNSAGHRENILYSGFTRVACKKAIINGVVYWIQLFGY